MRPAALDPESPFHDLEELLRRYGLELNLRPGTSGAWTAVVSDRGGDRSANYGWTAAEAIEGAVERWVSTYRREARRGGGR